MYPSTTTADACAQACIHPTDVVPLLGRVIDVEAAAATADLFGILSDPTRLRLLHALSQTDELCVCDLAVLIGTSQSAVSHQLRTLRAAGAVTRRRLGRIMAYRLADSHVRRLLLAGIAHAGETR